MGGFDWWIAYWVILVKLNLLTPWNRRPVKPSWKRIVRLIEECGDYLFVGLSTGSEKSELCVQVSLKRNDGLRGRETYLFPRRYIWNDSKTCAYT